MANREVQFGASNVKNNGQAEITWDVAIGLAHVIRNPLTGIKGALEIFYREREFSVDDRAVFEEMLRQVRKLDVITRNFLEYARPPLPRFARTNIHDVIHSALAFITRYDLHKSIRSVSVVREFDESIPVINADPMQLQQVFMHLIITALDAMGEDGTLKFRTARLNELVEIQVSDTGRGLGEEITNRVFQPFFTTETREFGVGLSISKRLIEQHGGEIAAEGDETGNVFRITLPVEREASSSGLNHSLSAI